MRSWTQYGIETGRWSIALRNAFLSSQSLGKPVEYHAATTRSWYQMRRQVGIR
jgi:hypothetical protein